MKFFFSAKKDAKDVSKKEPAVVTPAEQFGKGKLRIADIIAPSSIETDFNYIRIGETFYKTLFVVGYPRFASLNWLQPLIDFNHELNTTFYIYPIESQDILSDLRRKIAELEATIASENERGRVINPSVTVTLEDALSVQESLAKGIERFFQLGLYITLSAKSVADLTKVVKELSATLSSLLIIVKT